MKKIVTSYTFTAASKTVQSADFTSLEKIQLITNVTSNVIIYNFADPLKGGAVSGTTLTLLYNTASMSNTDKLQIFVDDSLAAWPVTDNGGSITVDGTVAVSGTTAVSAASLPLPTGAATAALQTQPGVDIGDVTINNSTGVAAVNIQDGGNSITVDGTVAVSGTTAISAASLPLPSGAATSALQTTGNTSVGNIDTKTPALGQATMANSRPVVLASNQSAVAVDTELSAAVALGDGIATQTTAPVVSYPVIFNGGTTFDRARGGQGDGAGAAGLQDIVPRVYNGSTYDRTRSAAGVTGAVAIGGLTASGSTLAAAPVTSGGLAKTANPTAVTDGQVVNSLYDKVGKQVVVGSIRALKGDQATTITSSTTETTIVAAGAASVFRDVYLLTISNTSATATEVTIRDVTAGGTAQSFMVPAGDIRGFALPESAGRKQGTAASAWTAQCGTSVAAVKVYAAYVENV